MINIILTRLLVNSLCFVGYNFNFKLPTYSLALKHKMNNGVYTYLHNLRVKTINITVGDVLAIHLSYRLILYMGLNSMQYIILKCNILEP